MKSNHKGLMYKILQKKLRKTFEESKLKIQVDSTRKIIVWHGNLTLTLQKKKHSQRADDSI